MQWLPVDEDTELDRMVIVSQADGMTGTVDGDEFSIEYQQEFRRTEEDGDEFCTLDLELVGERV